MSGAGPKTTQNDVLQAVEAIEPANRRDDARRLIDLMSRVTGEPPRLWGSMIGFGSYHYRYDSGHEGDTFLVGFAPRKSEFSIYLMGTYGSAGEDISGALFGRLGKHRRGKACLYVKRLDQIDLYVLEELVNLSVSALQQRYPDDAGRF